MSTLSLVFYTIRQVNAMLILSPVFRAIPEDF